MGPLLVKNPWTLLGIQVRLALAALGTLDAVDRSTFRATLVTTITQFHFKAPSIDRHRSQSRLDFVGTM